MSTFTNIRSIISIVVLALIAFLFSGQAAAQTKIMLLGNSITQGVQNNSPDDVNDEGYRKPLYDLLTAESVSFDFVGSLSSGSVVGFDPDHEGHRGWMADEMVSIMIVLAF